MQKIARQFYDYGVYKEYRKLRGNFMIIVFASHPVLDLKEFSKYAASKFGVNYIDIDESTLHKNSGIFHSPPSSNMVCSGFVLANRFEEGVVKVYIKYSEEYIARYIMDTNKVSFEDALKEARDIENRKREWLKNFFGIDIRNLDVYDLVISSDSLDSDGVVSIVERYLTKVKK